MKKYSVPIYSCDPGCGCDMIFSANKVEIITNDNGHTNWNATLIIDGVKLEFTEGFGNVIEI